MRHDIDFSPALENQTGIFQTGVFTRKTKAHIDFGNIVANRFPRGNSDFHGDALSKSASWKTSSIWCTIGKILPQIVTE